MGKLKGIKIPRKLKKEVWKIECWEREAPSFHSSVYADPFGRGDSLYSFGTFMPKEVLKLKEGVKVNKWTRRLIRKAYREKRQMYKTFHEKEVERIMGWQHKGISPIDSFAETMKRKSPDEFRREYLNEPIPENDAVFKGLPELGRYSKVRQLDNGLKPGFIIIDDMDDSMPNFRTKQEELEWIERVKLWHASMIQPDANGDCFAPKAVIKIDKEDVKNIDIEKFPRFRS